MEQPEPAAPAAPARPPVVHLLAAAVGVVPFYALVIFSEFATLNQGGGFIPPDLLSTLANLAVNLLAFGGLMLLLLYYVSGDNLRSLQSKHGDLATDLGHGLSLALILLILQLAVNVIIGSRVGGSEGPVEAVAQIAQTLSDNPLLLAVWLGPVVWLQGGLFEEFQRVFLLSRLWQVYPSPSGQLLSILGGSLLFGLGHLYQGAWGIPLTALIGATLGLHYWRYRRVLPLIIAHGIYNTVVLGLVVAAVRQGLL